MSKWTEFSTILKPSPLGGIGVFAMHNIPKGTELFTYELPTRRLKRKDIPAEFLKYCIHISDDECFAPAHFDCMEIAWYMNHSNQPNVMLTAKTEIFSICDISAGEEILVDYHQLNEPKHLKEPYYR